MTVRWRAAWHGHGTKYSAGRNEPALHAQLGDAVVELMTGNAHAVDQQVPAGTYTFLRISSRSRIARRCPQTPCCRSPSFVQR